MTTAMPSTPPSRRATWTSRPGARYVRSDRGRAFASTTDSVTVHTLTGIRHLTLPAENAGVATPLTPDVVRLTHARSFTQQVSRFVWERATDDGAAEFASIHYLSRHDEAADNWALFELEPTDPPASWLVGEDEDEMPLLTDDADLVAAIDQHRIVVHLKSHSWPAQANSRRLNGHDLPKSSWASKLTTTLAHVDVSRTIPLISAERQQYLDPVRTGSPWLFDPERMAQYHVRLPRGAVVDARAAADDIRSFGSLLRDTYARYDRYAEAGLDVDAVIDRHAHRVAAHHRVKFADAFLPLLTELRTAVPDNHLNPGMQERADLWSSPELLVREFRGPVDRLDDARRAAGAITSTAQRVPLLQQGTLDTIGSVAALGVEGESALRAAGFKPVSDATPESALMPIDGTAYSFRRSGTTGIVRLPDFDLGRPGVSEQLDQFVADAAKHRESERLVIDLRGNGGGSTFPIMRWAAAMRTPASVHREAISSRFGSGLQEAVSTWNVGAYIGANYPDEPWAKAVIDAGRATQKLWPLGTETPASPQASGPELRGTADSDWNGEILVLVDRRNASSGELAALTLRDWLGAKIVGERTGGFLEGLNVQPYQLPATGLLVNVPSIEATFDDTRIHEGAGLPVDIALADPAASAESIADALAASRENA